MAESLFDIFGDHHIKRTVKNVSRQPLTNIENTGKAISTGPIKPNPIKPNEPMKKAEGPKKSFLSNTGKALQNTPARNVFTPRAVNLCPVIYSDESTGLCGEDIEFHKPSNVYDNYHKDLFDYLVLPEPDVIKQITPNTPSPKKKRHSMEFNSSYKDEFFTDDFSLESIPDDDDLGLPDLY